MKKLREQIKDILHANIHSGNGITSVETKEIQNQILDLIEKRVMESLPEVKEQCDCEKSELGYHTKDCDFSAYGWNHCRGAMKQNLKLLFEEI